MIIMNGNDYCPMAMIIETFNSNLTVSICVATALSRNN